MSFLITNKYTQLDLSIEIDPSIRKWFTFILNGSNRIKTGEDTVLFNITTIDRISAIIFAKLLNQTRRSYCINIVLVKAYQPRNKNPLRVPYPFLPSPLSVLAWF